jgi:hypothetical protein
LLKLGLFAFSKTLAGIPSAMMNKTFLFWAFAICKQNKKAKKIRHITIG